MCASMPKLERRSDSPALSSSEVSVLLWLQGTRLRGTAAKVRRRTTRKILPVGECAARAVRHIRPLLRLAKSDLRRSFTAPGEVFSFVDECAEGGHGLAGARAHPHEAAPKVSSDV